MLHALLSCYLPFGRKSRLELIVAGLSCRWITLISVVTLILYMIVFPRDWNFAGNVKISMHSFPSCYNIGCVPEMGVCVQLEFRVIIIFEFSYETDTTQNHLNKPTTLFDYRFPKSFYRRTVLSATQWTTDLLAPCSNMLTWNYHIC